MAISATKGSSPMTKTFAPGASHLGAGHPVDDEQTDGAEDQQRGEGPPHRIGEAPDREDDGNDDPHADYLVAGGNGDIMFLKLYSGQTELFSLLYSPGVLPIHRLKLLLKTLGSENPSMYDISSTE